jgi:hypothetical protein
MASARFRPQMFCLQPERLPVFIAFLRANGIGDQADPGWYDAPSGP